eukprot:SAG11_NODE_27378_length_333_cov_1.055556_1_plen_49_part_10
MVRAAFFAARRTRGRSVVHPPGMRIDVPCGMPLMVETSLPRKRWKPAVS